MSNKAAFISLNKSVTYNLVAASCTRGIAKELDLYRSDTPMSLEWEVSKDEQHACPPGG